jgi:hypothetical protein
MKHSTLFIDESGKSSLVEKANEPFLLTGVILDTEEITPVEGFFNYIKRKHEIELSHPFHCYDIFENPRSKLTDTKAKAVIGSIAEFISLIPIKIMVISIDKAEFRKALGVKSDEDLKGSKERREMREYPYRIMSSILFKWFADYLETTGGIGQIIVDARRGGDYQLLKTLNLCKDPNGPLDKKSAQLIKDRCNAICFAEKNFLSAGLEITDLVSYVSFFYSRRLLSSMNSINLRRVWQQIKSVLEGKDLYKLNAKEVKVFFKVGSDGVHKYLKT